jgi:cobalt-precorrin-5B (C1)-methyltransferase
MYGQYKIVDGKRLRYGYTTGSCAAAAAKGAAALLLGGGGDSAEIDIPAGKRLRLPLYGSVLEGSGAAAAVRKDGGGENDVTSGCLVYARVTKTREPGFAVEGGEGVGRVTLPGLDAPVGAAAINSVPLRMIRAALTEVCESSGFTGGLRVSVSVPGGEKLAERTFNRRLGIVGGISILGTTGIVEPASEAAFLGSIKVELSVLRAAALDAVTLTPGNIGADFIKRHYPGTRPIKCANFIGESVCLAAAAGFRRVLIAGHIGKLVKLVAGSFNTHSRYGDARLFIFAAFAGLYGADSLLQAELLRCATSEAAIEMLMEARLWEPVLKKILLTTRLQLDEFCARRGYEFLRCEALFFSSKHGFLGKA